MVLIAPSQPGDMLARQKSAKRAVSSAAKKPERPRNVEPILSLGEMTFFMFRGRAYGVPPLPWKVGQRLTEAHVRALEGLSHLAAHPFDAKGRKEYYSALGELARLLGRNCQPTGKLRRLLHSLRLFPNPFGKATDAEILEHADFFLSRRMKSGVPSPTPTDPNLLRTS